MNENFGNFGNLFNTKKSKGESDEEKGLIMETDGQLEDYFDADKDDPFRMNNDRDENLSPPNNNNNSFLVSGLITKT